MSEWKETTLADLCTDISYGYTESAKQEKVGPKFLRITDIASGRLEWENVPYCPIDESNFEKYKLLPGDIVIARTGATTGANYTIKESDPKDVVFASYLIRYKINSQIANSYYIGQLLRSPNWSDYVDAIAGGSAQPGANAKQLGSFEILLPPLPIQTSIASILSSLDDKIDLLHRQNATLEKMAETLFRQWFVEEEKEEWEEVELGDLIDVVIDNRGKTPPTVTYQTDYPLIEVNALNSESCLVDYTVIRKYVSKDTFETWFRKHLKINDIIISTVGTIGVFSIHLINKGGIAQNLIGLRSNKISAYYLYNFFKHNKELLISLDIGGVQPSIKVPHLLELTIKLPEKELLNKYDETVKNYFDKITTNYNQIQTLTALRDTLLPKLMSGEVRVENY